MPRLYYELTAAQLTALNAAVTTNSVPAGHFSFISEKSRAGLQSISKRTFDMLRSIAVAADQTAMDAAIAGATLIDWEQPQVIVFKNRTQFFKANTNDQQILWDQVPVQNRSTIYGLQYRIDSGNTTELWGVRLHEGWYETYVNYNLVSSVDYDQFALLFFRDGVAISDRYEMSDLYGAVVTLQEGHNQITLQQKQLIHVPAGEEHNYEWRLSHYGGASVNNTLINARGGNQSTWMIRRLADAG